MPSLLRNWWQNYHGNLSGVVRSSTTYLRDPPASAAATPTIDLLACSAKVLKSYVEDLIGKGQSVRVIGSGWTLSDLLAADAHHLNTDELDYIVPLDPGELHETSPYAASACVLVGGGTKTYQLVTYAEQPPRGLSISTCGSYLGPSVGGALATSVNGSTLGFGGFQNQVVGLHLIVSGERSVWVERAGAPVLADKAALGFADCVVRDDDIFDGALVHLGGMGIVNALAFQLTPKLTFSAMRKRAQVDRAWLGHLAEGQFREVAGGLGHDQSPYYYEVQIDPFAPFETPALHTLYFQQDGAAPGSRSLARVTVADALARAGRRRAAADAGAAAEPAMVMGFPAHIITYYAENFFDETPGGQPTGAYSFGQLHDDPPRQELQGQIYTAAFSIERGSTAAVVPLLQTALIQTLNALPAPENQARHILYTLRFVSNAAGALAFTPFPESVVFDIEGLMASPVSEILGKATYAALDGAGVPHARHWAKLLSPSADQVDEAFGKATSRIALWRKARNTLVPPAAQRVFQSKALRDWGLI